MSKFWCVLLSSAIGIAMLSSCSNPLDQLSFAGGELTYDGYSHIFEVTGNVPEGFYIEYSNNNVKDAGTYQASAFIKKASDDSLVKTLEATIVINPYLVDNPVLETSTFTYSGEVIDVFPFVSSYYSVSGNQNIEVGDYNVVFSLYDKKNYNWRSGGSSDYQLSYSIKPIMLDVPSFTNENPNYDLYSDLYDVIPNSDEGNKSVTVSLKDKDHYVWSDNASNEDKNINLEIDGLEIEEPVVNKTTFVYRNNPLSLDIREDKYYTIYDNLAEKPGVYRTRISLNDKKNYIWKNSKTSADIEIQWLVTTTVNYPNATYSFAYTDISSCADFLDLTYIDVVEPLEFLPGTYEITAKLKDTAYLSWEDKSKDDYKFKVTITKKALDKSNLVFENREFEYDGKEHSIFASGIPEEVNVSYLNNGKVGSPNERSSFTVIANFDWNKELYTFVDKISGTMTIVPYVNFDTNGGTTLEKVEVTPDSTKTLSSYVPEKFGYSFSGWTDSNGQPAPDDTVLNKAETYIAQWTGNPVTLSLVGNDGVIIDSSGTNYDEKIVNYGGEYNLPTAQNANGDKFEGWLDYSVGKMVDLTGTWNNGLYNRILRPVFSVNDEKEEGMSVSCIENKTITEINSLPGIGGGLVIALDDCEYYKTETSTGYSEQIVTENEDNIVGAYKFGTNCKIELPRFDNNGRDYAYKKFYVIQDGEISKGPIYCTSTNAKYNPSS